MKNMVRNRIRNDPYYSFGLNPLEQEDALILRAAAGRFGKFSETYQLPSHVDTEGINATYERGVLKVEIPKIKQRPAPVSQRAPSYGYPSSFARRPNPMGFFW